MDSLDSMQIITYMIMGGLVLLALMILLLLGMAAVALAQKIGRRKALSPAPATVNHHRYHGKHRITGEYPHA